MSESNGDGVIRIGHKGKKKFAIGEEGKPFEVDVVVALYEWISIDSSFRDKGDEVPDPKTGRMLRTVSSADMQMYHQAAVSFVSAKAGGEVTTAEALDFLARLREQHDELVDFFRPRSLDEPESPDTSEVALEFSEEPDPSPPSTSVSSSAS